MIELLKEKHELELEFGKKKFTFIYYDATLRELIEFMHVNEEKMNMSEWLFLFLKKNCYKNGKIYTGFKKKYFNKIHRTQQSKILNVILKKWSCGMYGEKEKKVKKIKNNDFFNSNEEDKSPDSALIMRLVEYSNETLDSLMNKTWRTITYMLEGMMWNIRSETSEGQRENMKEFAKKKAKEKGLDVNEMMKKRLEKLKAKMARENKDINKI